jgi:hypothetical protein
MSRGCQILKILVVQRLKIEEKIVENERFRAFSVKENDGCDEENGLHQG